MSGDITSSRFIGGGIYSSNPDTTTPNTYLKLTDGTFSFANGKLTYDGTTLNVNGKITANEGSIGGCNITQYGISSDNWYIYNNGYAKFENVIINNNSGRSTLSWGENFSVNSNGMLSASGASISGSITATSGKIGGCELENGVLKVDRINIKDNAVGYNEIAPECINSDLIVKGGIKADRIEANSITTEQLAADVLSIKNMAGDLYYGTIDEWIEPLEINIKGKDTITIYTPKSPSFKKRLVCASEPD